MIDLQDLKDLLALEGARPCVSLYQPTHRQHPENRQDPIRFRNLVKQSEASLQRAYGAQEIEPLLAPYRALAEDADFWNHTVDGLAVFGAPGRFRIVRLQRPVSELVVVADSFHVKPMLRIVQSADRYQVLSLNRREIRLFEGNRDVLDEIEPADGVPRTITEALGDELTDSHVHPHSYGTGPAATGAGASRGRGGPKTGGMRHGQGTKKDEMGHDTERFFRAVDRGVLAHHSRPTGLPLILAGLPEHHAPFRSVSHNPQLIDAGIEIGVDALSIDELRQRAWQAMEPAYLARLTGLVERFRVARSAQRGDDRLVQVSVAAAGGRVDTLLLEAERKVPGRLDAETGVMLKPDDLAHPEVDDMLDDLAERVLRTGGDVVILPAARMPSTTGLAAIYRF